MRHVSKFCVGRHPPLEIRSSVKIKSSHAPRLRVFYAVGHSPDRRGLETLRSGDIYTHAGALRRLRLSLSLVLPFSSAVSREREKGVKETGGIVSCRRFREG